MLTKSWRQLAEALGPGMIDLRKFQDMDRQQGRPEKLPGGSGFFGQDELGADDSQSMGRMRPPQELPSPEGGDREHEIDIFGMDDLDDQQDESRFDKMVGKLSHQKGVHDPRKLAAFIGINKYGAKGMAARRKHH